MKKIAKRLLYSLILIFTLTSCATHNAIMSADSHARKLELGMTKGQVISIMGDKYEVIGSKEGIFTLGYKSSYEGIYKLIFIDGKLKEWNKEWFKGNYIIESGSNKANKSTN